MQVVIDNRQSDLSLAGERVAPIIQSVLHLEGESADEVGVHFVSQEEIGRLHQEYFGDPSPTDCISLPLTREGPYIHLGDLFVCPKTALLYTEEHGGDPYWEATLYLVHALLHLLGYDDKEGRALEKMRLAEKRHMEALEKQGALLVS